MIKARTIGAAEVQIGRKRITTRTEVVFALTVYLCVRAGERVTRDEVLEVFWPGSDPTNGRHSMRQMLYRMRQRDFVLDEDGEELYLDPARVECDLTLVLADAWPESADPFMVEATDDFLPGFTREISPQFRHWLDAMRARLATQYRRAALRQIVQARREGRWADLERWGGVVLRSDPLNEEATLARAESAAMAGSKAMALEILDQYTEDLGERAGQIGLPAAVLRKRISERRPEWGGPESKEVPLVGREGLMSCLTEAAEGAALGQGIAFVLGGAPGIGKTRIGNEVRAFVEFAGFRSVVLRVAPTSRRQPLSVALKLIPQLLELRGAAGCAPMAMSLLRSATSPVRTDAIHTPTTTTPDALAWALSALLEVLSEEAKLFVLLDDLHHCDDESLFLLGKLTPTASALRIMWLATARVGRSHEDAIAHRPSGFVPISVPPLSKDSTLELAREYAQSAQDVRSERDLTRIAGLSGGNPLFLRELSALRGPALDGHTTPASLKKLIAERLSDLTSHELRVLQLVSLLGSHATVLRVRALTRRSPDDLVYALEQLSHLGLLSLRSHGVLELHESWQTAVFEHIAPSARAALALECAELLEHQESQDDAFDRAWRAAELYLESGEHRQSAQLFEHAGDQLRDRRLLAEAAGAYNRALAVLGPAGESLALLAKLASVQHAAQDFAATLSTYSRAESGVRRVSFDDPSAQLHLLALLVDASWKSGHEYSSHLELLARRASQPDISLEACHFASLVGLRLLLNDRKSSLEGAFLSAIDASTKRHGPSVLGQLAILIFQAERGTVADVLALERTLAATSLETLPPITQVLSLRYRSNAMRWIGSYDLALAHGTESVARATTFGFLDELGTTALQLSFMCMDQTDLAAAAYWLARSPQTLQGGTADVRTRAYAHACSRLLFQQGKYHECLDCYESNGVEPAADLLGKRSAVTASTIAAAAALTGRPELAAQMLAISLPVVMQESPTVTLDYIAELTVRGMRALKQTAHATEVADTYLRRRRDHFERPLAPFLVSLAAVPISP